MNLVARGERAHISVHVAEAAAVAGHLPIEDRSRWVDLGTGGGLPGLVLAVLHPHARFMLLDATRKKVEAVRGFADELGLTNVEVRCGRAEVVAREDAHRGAYDGVVSRAVAGLVTVLELSRGFVRAGGVVAAIKGPQAEQEVASVRGVLGLLGLAGVTTTPVPAAARPTVLVTMTADGPVPDAVPRGDGVPASTPLVPRP